MRCPARRARLMKFSFRLRDFDEFEEESQERVGEESEEEEDLFLEREDGDSAVLMDDF